MVRAAPPSTLSRRRAKSEFLTSTCRAADSAARQMCPEFMYSSRPRALKCSSSGCADGGRKQRTRSSSVWPMPRARWTLAMKPVFLISRFVCTSIESCHRAWSVCQVAVQQTWHTCARRRRTSMLPWIVCRRFLGWSVSSHERGAPRAASRERDTKNVTLFPC